MFTLDSRLATKDKVAVSNPYKGKVQFNCLTTTSMGGIAIGSLDGAIRLYK